MEIIYEYHQIDEAAIKFLKVLKGYKVFAFTGDLGAGKTTFINALCKEMKVRETVTSPTYSIIQEYRTAGDKVIYHIDLYRIRSEEEAISAGIEDCINSDEICMVEWPEKAPEVFPYETVFTHFQVLDSNIRKLIVQLPQ